MGAASDDPPAETGGDETPTTQDPQGSAAADDRRSEERRSEERRAFRREEGRREDSPRRSSERKLGRRVLLLAMLAIVAFGARATCVAPRRAAEQTARLVEPTVDLSAIRPVGIAVPGLGEPLAGPPAEPVGPTEPSPLADARLRLEASRGGERVPRLLELLGPIRFALGDLPAARRAWEELGVQGSGEQIAAARVGLAAVAIATASRPDLPAQDRAFTLEHAVAQVADVGRDGPSGAAAAANHAIALLMLDRVAEAEPLVATLAGTPWATVVATAVPPPVPAPGEPTPEP